MTVSDFASLGLEPALLRALAAREYLTPTPIQARAIPHLLEGKDLLGIAQTGTGKTAAFALPMLQRLAEIEGRPEPMRPSALVLAPTRELATQIADAFKAYGKHLHLTVAIVFGGVGQMPQVQALRRGVDILVATPGRLLDLIKQRHCNLSDVEILVLDEADRMLDMGFLPDVRRILSTLPRDRQSLLFSATMPDDITKLANSLLRDPVRVEVTPPAATVDRIEQSVYFVKKDKKRDLLVQLLQDPAFERTLVFTRTKHGADRVAKFCDQAGIEAYAIHGNKSQNQRERALDAFRKGRCRVLIATDIAARGIDVPEITHVVNFDLPNIPESYVHRIGRTARAGRDGIAIAFCDNEEREFLRDIEKLIRKRVPVAVGGGSAPVAQKPSPAAQPAPKRHPENPWHNEAAGDDADREADHENEREQGELVESKPKLRQRPPARPAPGPYAPSPQRAHKPAPHGHRGPPPKRRSRPAQPNVVDPELRRPGPRPESHGSGPQRQAPRGPAPRGPASRGPAQQRPGGKPGGGGPRRRRR